MYDHYQKVTELKKKQSKGVIEKWIKIKEECNPQNILRYIVHLWCHLFQLLHRKSFFTDGLN